MSSNACKRGHVSADTASPPPRLAVYSDDYRRSTDRHNEALSPDDIRLPRYRSARLIAPLFSLYIDPCRPGPLRRSPGPGRAACTIVGEPQRHCLHFVDYIAYYLHNAVFLAANILCMCRLLLGQFCLPARPSVTSRKTVIKVRCRAKPIRVTTGRPVAKGGSGGGSRDPPGNPRHC